jgi:imidazolonepropionase-like amidohydrolase
MTSTGESFRLLKASRLIDGLGGPVRERAAVLLEGDKIRQVGTEETVSAPDGAAVEEVDYGDRTILPGLVDCHVHLIGIGDGRAGDELTTLPDEVLTVQAARNARAHLYSGVTTIRDCGAKNQTTFALRQAVEMGITPAPRLILAGRPMAIVGGHLSYFGVQATGPVECRAAVRQLIKEGADYIKITATGGSTRTSFPLLPSFTVEELTAICDEVHKFGKHAAAHCASSQGMVNALDAGVDTIIHGIHKERDGVNRFRPEIAECIAEQGVFVNSTLNGARARIELLEATQEEVGLTDADKAQLDTMRAEHEVRLDDFARMRSAGVTMVCGSDSAWGNYKMGDFQSEIEAAVIAGMSPTEAIVASTNDSARSCWAEDSVGSLEPGKNADLLIVDGDPTQRISDLRNIVDVIQGGATVDRGNFI